VGQAPFINLCPVAQDDANIVENIDILVHMRVHLKNMLANVVLNTVLNTDVRIVVLGEEGEDSAVDITNIWEIHHSL
jgi:hypothetical protein